MKEDIGKLEKGSHICCIYRNRDEQIQALIPFIVAGLKNNDRCVAILSGETKNGLLQTLLGLGLDVSKCNIWGQFSFPRLEDTFLKHDVFDPDKIFYLLKDTENETARNGFNGLRLIVEASGFYHKLSETKRFMEFEARFNNILANSRNIAMCQYSEEAFNSDILLNVLSVHPKVILRGQVYDNKYYTPPEKFLSSGIEHKGLTYEQMRDSFVV